MFVSANAVMSKVNTGKKCVGQIYSLGQGMEIILFYRNGDSLETGKTVYS